MAKAKKTTTPIDRPVTVRTTATERVLCLQGVVGVAQAKLLHACALELATPGPAVVIHAEHVRHLDCAAVQVLLALRDALKRLGVDFTCATLPASVTETLAIAGLGDLCSPAGVSQ